MATVQETKVKAGFEEIHAIATAKLEALEETIKKEIEEKFNAEATRLNRVIAECVEVVDVEVPDVEESVEAPIEAETAQEVY